MAGEVPTRRLGKTEESVSVLGLGGYHLGLFESASESVRFVRAAIDRGITFIDNCWDYHDGESERRVGEALQGGYREKAFVMTKVDGRTYDSARAQILQSLMRLRVDQVDLMQLHEVIRQDDPDRIFAPDGAIKALAEARDEGLVRLVGFTGHKSPAILLKMLEHDFEFDTVQMPLNILDAGYDSFQKKVLPVLLERGIGILGMKPLSSGMLVETGAVSAIEALHYALSLPTDVVINGLQSWEDLDQAVKAATSFEQMSREQMRRLEKRTAGFAAEGAYEEYKTTSLHDGTAQNPEWLTMA